MKKNTGKNQHYIPQMLLKGFGQIRKKRGGKSLLFTHLEVSRSP